MTKAQPDDLPDVKKVSDSRDLEFADWTDHETDDRSCVAWVSTETS
jgi:hypothetical protein